MRNRHLVFAAIMLFGCDSEQAAKSEAKAAAKVEAPAQVDADAAAKVEGEVNAKVDGDAEAAIDADLVAEADIEPRIGGTIVAAGDYNVELIAFVDGRIEAIVMDAKGELAANMKDLGVVATLAAEGDAKAKVTLAWNAELTRFVGAVDGDVHLVPGELHVEVMADGEANIGALANLGLAVQAEHGGQVMVAGDYAVEVAAKGGFVHAYVFDVGGRAHAKGDLDVRVAVDSGADIELKWDPPSASYKAELSGDVQLEAKPIVLHLEAAGAVAIAAVSSFHASAAVAAKSDLDAHADAEVHAPSVKAKAGGHASAHAGAHGGAKAEVKKSAGASGKASAKAGNGSAKAGASGKVKAKASFGF